MALPPGRARSFRCRARFHASVGLRPGIGASARSNGGDLRAGGRTGRAYRSRNGRGGASRRRGVWRARIASSFASLMPRARQRARALRLEAGADDDDEIDRLLRRRSRTAAARRRSPGVAPPPRRAARKAGARRATAGWTIPSSRFSAAGSSSTAAASRRAVDVAVDRERLERRPRPPRRRPTGRIRAPRRRRRTPARRARRTSRPTVDLPIAIEPVSPATIIVRPFSPARRSASTSARSSAVTSGVLPNQRAKPGAAWCSSMPSPSTATQPRRRAASTSGVAAEHRRRRRRPLRPSAARESMSSGGWPAMPRIVALTSRPASASSCGNSSQVAARAAGPKRSASATARARVRLTRRRARSRARPARGRSRAPRRPRPSPRRCRRDRRQPGASASRLARKPATSVLSPHSAPSSRHSVLTAPVARAAIGSAGRRRRRRPPCAAR